MDFDVIVVSATVFCDLIFVGLPGIPGAGQEFYSQGFALCPGGMGANSATALSRLGMRVALVSRIGRHPVGELLYRDLEREGIDVSHIQILDEEPTAVSAVISLPNDRCFITYPPPSPSAGLVPIDFDFESVKRAHYMLVSASDVTKDQLTRIREMGARVALDVGWKATEEPQRVLDLLPLVDVFVPNELEACRLTGTADAREALALLGRYVRQPVIKLGARGAIGLDGGRVVEVPAIDLKPIDTTGAGDVFAAGLLYGHLKGWPIAKCLRVANVCGALSTRGIGGGCSAPRWDDILKVAPHLCAVEQAGWV